MIIDAENRNFTTLNPLTMADWVAVGGGGTVVAGGVSGNAGLYTRDAAPNAMTLTLSSDDITALVIGNYYSLSFYVKYATTWDGGAVTVTMGDYSTTFTPTTSWQRVTLRFQADTTAMDIVLSDDTVVLTGANLLYLDTVTLSDCVLVVTHHAVPQKLVDDTDAPPSPLNLHQELIVNKSIEMLATTSPVPTAELNIALLMVEKYMQNFLRDIKGKGEGQSRMSHSNR